MPHGRLTPLGRQLRSVLASLRPASTCSQYGRTAYIPRHIFTDNTACARARGFAIPARGICNAAIRPQSATAVAVVAQDDGLEDERDDLYWSNSLADVDDEAYGVGRLAGIEEGATLKGEQEFETALDVGQSELPQTSIPNVSLRRGKEYPMYYRKKGPTTEIRLEETFASHVKHEAANEDAPSLSQKQQELLQAKGYSISTLKSWAAIVTNSDPYDAAMQLETLQTQHHTGLVPLFVLFHVLRQPYIGPRTLRVLLRVSFKTAERCERELAQGIDKEDLFTLFTLLLRRTRDVWPAAMESLVDMLLQYLPPKSATDQNSGVHDDQLASLGFRLNKAMRLLAVPTSINPFKTLNIQETCIIRILRFLAEHDPPLEINRDGFRAVISMQLAQPKSENDRLWAELKSLSWPPWKEDRTAMDSDIVASEHGRSKAAETLERMREAGFAPYEWEKVAAIYTGWDIDRTPTIQTRVLFNSGKMRFESGAAMWVARIRTTRTVQEAWACYLAYEEQTSAHDQDVSLSMFRKLHEEDNRVRNTRKYMHFRPFGDIWPGDTLEIEPPPPSSHQHTYTRRSPPTVDGFYRQLKGKGVVFEGHCLAFLISRADTLQLGLEYLLASERVYPNIHHLLDLEATSNLSDVPNIVLSAFLELLGRFSNFSLAKALPVELQTTKHALKLPVAVDDIGINADHPLAHGIRLLSRRLPSYRPAWNSIFRALGNSSSHQGLNATLFYATTTSGSQQGPRGQANQPEEDWKAVYTARRLVMHTMGLMRSIHLEADNICFIALCNAAENFAVSCWMKMRQQELTNEEVDPDLESAARMFRPRNYPTHMKMCFLEMVGDEGTTNKADDSGGLGLPPLVEIPSPAILHAYIRALGWMGDYDGMLEVAQWMTKYRTELQERRELDRNGEVIMRRVVVALRVFLERSWLARRSSDVDGSKSTLTGDPGRTEKRESIVRYHRADLSMFRDRLLRLQTAANKTLVAQVQWFVESTGDWGGWPTEEEVHDYCQHERFLQFNR